METRNWFFLFVKSPNIQACFDFPQCHQCLADHHTSSCCIPNGLVTMVEVGHSDLHKQISAYEYVEPAGKGFLVSLCSQLEFC